MELRQLQMFVSVAEHGSVTRAAEELLVAQPSVSSQIHALEGEVGHPLFDRLPRGVRLTEVGHVVLERARRILREVAAIEEDVDALAGLRRGRVVLGCVPTITDHLIATAVKTFRERHPAVETRVVESRTSVLMEGVAAHRLDLAVVTSMEEHPHVQVERLYDEELVAILGTSDPLARRAEIDLSELAEHPFLLLETGFGLRAQTWEACRNAGFTPRVVQEMESVQAIKGLVQIGMGVSVVPRTTVEQAVRLGLFSAVRLRTPRLSRKVEVATARGAYLTRAAQAFIAICREQAADQATAAQAPDQATAAQAPAVS